MPDSVELAPRNREWLSTIAKSSFHAAQLLYSITSSKQNHKHVGKSGTVVHSLADANDPTGRSSQVPQPISVYKQAPKPYAERHIITNCSELNS